MQTSFYISSYFHPDHLGSSTLITDNFGDPYQFFLNLPFGANERKSHAVFLEVCERSSMAEQRRNGSFDNPYKFNDYGGKSFKKAFDEHTARSAELDPETGLYYYGARYYNPRTSVWLSVDPLAEVQPDKTPYHFVSNNPISRVDPTGMLDHEYDKDGNKISDLGGDKIDFHHQANGDTKIVDKQTGASNIIAGGEALIRGYTQRDNSTGWGTLFYEWDQGTGPTKSMFADFDNTTTGVFGSFDKIFSVYAGKARASVLSEGQSKGSVKFGYGDINPLTAGFDGWEQFIGRANLSYYKLGDKVLYLMNDSKSMTSFMYRMSPSWERSDFRLNGNTYQTYIWTETMQEVQQKNQIRVDYINQLQKARQEYRNTEHQRLPSIKW